MASFTDLNIATKANAGVVVSVVIPGGAEGEGIKTGDTLTVLSTYSERFRKAEAEGYRRIREAHNSAKASNESIDDQLYEEVMLNSIVQLVSAWSYEEPCTPENVRLFLDANPHMYDIVNRTAADHAFFFSSASNS